MTNKLPAALKKGSPLKTRTRVAIVRTACVLLAGAAAWPLLDLTLTRKSADLMAAPKATQRVRLHAAAPKVMPAKRAHVLVRSERAPLKPIVAKDIKPIEISSAVLQELPQVEVAAPPEPPKAQPMPAIPQLFVVQPELPNAKPPIPPDDLPPITSFSDKPGGSIVILAVKLNSDNVVVLTDILVASGTPFNDLALAMGTTGGKWGKVDPPIPPGEHRWVEVRIDYAAPKNDNSSVLP